MRIYLVFIVCSVFISCSSMGQKKEDLICLLTIEGGFKNDTLSLKVNECEVLKETLVVSSENDGITDVQVSLHRHKNLLYVDLHGEDEMICKIEDDRLKFTIIVNTSSKVFEVDLSKGKYLSISKSELGIELSQNKTQPLYD